MEEIFTKQYMLNNYNFFVSLLTTGVEPSSYTVIATKVVGKIINVVGSKLKVPTNPYVAAAIAASYAIQYVSKKSYSDKVKLRDRYKAEYDFMNNNGFVAVRMVYPSSTLLNEGVRFYDGLPNAVAYQNSSGNWIEKE